MNLIERIRGGEDGALMLGLHPRILQSILDFDRLSGKERPSVLGIVSANRSAHKCFWGKEEMLLPCYASIGAVPPSVAKNVRWMLSVQSGRRAASAAIAFFDAFPNALGGTIFAENVPEVHATDLIARYAGKKLLSGPASVGFVVPGALKLGAAGGIDAAQITGSFLERKGSIAVVSTSGGMTNELITAAAKAGKGVSFALAIGGDRFPVASLSEVLALAEEDAATKAIAYFGELGGEDEYEIAALIKEKKLTKPVVAYIAGVVDDVFPERMQFGHAKALARTRDESARAKRDALKAAGAVVPETFPAFIEALSKTPGTDIVRDTTDLSPYMTRRESILSTKQIIDTDAAPLFVEKGKLLPRTNSFSSLALDALLPRPAKSPTTKAFADAVFSLLIDHGGAVSGAVNTMITARAGKDMVSSLASGILTIGPRFGGAINEGARGFLRGTTSGVSAAEFVEAETKAGRLILGIGHKKYRVGMPDPRVAALSGFAELLSLHPRYDFARAVEAVTTGKQGSLILNVDGVIASLFMDILAECEGYTDQELEKLIDAEFFNALFVIPRSVGFIAHFMEQKRSDEGLFRLPEDLLYTRKPEEE